MKIGKVISFVIENEIGMEKKQKNIAAMRHKCCICGKRFVGYGNNPRPVKWSGVCCDDCNRNVVIPARLN